MRVVRLLVAPPLAAGLRQLDDAESHYLVSVLRRRRGDAVRVFDGTGRSADAIVETADRRSCALHLEAPFAEDNESPLAVHLGLALLKGDRMDTALQKACELGVARITPLVTARTEVRLDGKRLANKLRHWSEVLRNAAQQSHRTALPTLDEPATLESFLATRGDAPGYLMQPGAAAFDDGTPPPQGVMLLPGPEGGFDDTELAAADAQGWQALGAGPRVLRAETAPLVGLTLLQLRWGDLR